MSNRYNDTPIRSRGSNTQFRKKKNTREQEYKKLDVWEVLFENYIDLFLKCSILKKQLWLISMCSIKLKLLHHVISIVLILYMIKI